MNLHYTPKTVRTLSTLALSALGIGIVPHLHAQTTPSTQAQGTGTIRGRVSAEGEGTFLRSAVVSVVGTNLEVLTGPGGTFTLSGVPAGIVTVRASYTGRQPQELQIDVSPSVTSTADFTLGSAFSDNTEGDIVDLEAFTVTSEARSGSARAVMEQKIALNPIKVVAADSLGNISEGNAGEFLKLMPGVSLDYVEADARSVRISGLAPQYGNVLLEGLFVPSAGSSNIATGRVFEFEQLSMDSVEIVQLTKTPTPDQPSSLSGTVNLVTESAFDHDGRHIEYSAGFATNSYYASLQKTEGWDSEEHYKLLPNYSFKFSDTFMDGKLGVNFGTSHHHTIAAQKHIWFWANDYDTDLSNNDSEVPVINWMWFQDGPKPTTRENYFARVDYLVSDNFKLFFRIDYSTYESQFYNRTFSLRPVTYDKTVEYSKTSQTISSGNVFNDSNQFMEKLGDTTIFTLGGEYEQGDLKITARINQGVATNWYENLENGHFTDYSTALNGVSWRWTRSSPGSTDLNFTQLTGPDWRNPANYAFVANSIAWHERNSEDKQVTARVDFVHDWKDWSVSNELKYGVMLNTRELEVHRWGSLQTSLTGPDKVQGTTDDPNPSLFLDDNFTPDYDAGGNINGITPLSPWKLYKYYQEHPEAFVNNDARNGAQRRTNNWYFQEKVLGAYLTDVFYLGKFDIAPGLRYEYSTPEGTGWDAVNQRPISGEGESADVLLKYLHANYNLRDDVVLRFSYHDSVTRANIANLIPGISAIDDTNRRLTASNPDLKEERAQTFYFTVEKYFEPIGVISVSAFHRVWEDRQINGREVTLGNDGYLGDPNFAGWKLVTTVNAGSSVDLNGIEIDFNKQFTNLPKPLTGLGVFANYTYLDYEDWRFFLGSPRRTANAGFNVGVGKFNARLNANYTGTVLNNPAASYNVDTNTWTTAAPYVKYYQKDRLFLDMNLEYMVSQSFRIFVDARNLTNEASQYTYRHDEDNFERILKTGTIWKVGVKGSF